MNANQFLKNPFKEAEEWEESQTTLEIYRSYKESTLAALIKYYSSTEANKAEDRKERLRVLQEIIAWKLKIPMFDYFIDTLMGRIQEIESSIEKLGKYERHRHKTIMGLYTEKPVY